MIRKARGELGEGSPAERSIFPPRLFPRIGDFASYMVTLFTFFKLGTFRSRIATKALKLHIPSIIPRGLRSARVS